MERGINLEPEELNSVPTVEKTFTQQLLSIYLHQSEAAILVYIKLL